MTTEKFELLLDQLDKTSLNTLKEKNRKYTAESGDALHNFRVGAALDGSTMPQTIWHYWKKHFTSLMDKIQKDDWNDKDDAFEKIQDSINYLRFIWCAINDDDNNEKKFIFKNDKNDEDKDEVISCNDCVYCSLSDDDNNWDELMSKMIIEPCKSCKGNFSILEEEYKTAPNNFLPKNK